MKPVHSCSRGKCANQALAQQEFDLNLARCWMIGHTTVDILAGSRGGVGTILVETGQGGQDGAYLVDPHQTVPTVRDAVRFVNSYEMSLRC